MSVMQGASHLLTRLYQLVACSEVELCVCLLQLVSRPAFDVEIDRDGDKLLVIHCVLFPPTDLPMSLDDTLTDTFCEFFSHILTVNFHVLFAK